jgi:hypothetical protein
MTPLILAGVKKGADIFQSGVATPVTGIGGALSGALAASKWGGLAAPLFLAGQLVNIGGQVRALTAPEAAAANAALPAGVPMTPALAASFAGAAVQIIGQIGRVRPV